MDEEKSIGTDEVSMRALPGEEADFHQQNLQIRGIYLPGMKELTDSRGELRYRLVRLRFSPLDSLLEPVPIKLAAVPKEKTPYAWVDGELQYQNEPFPLENVLVEYLPMRPEEDPWHYKGYTLPFDGTRNPYHELRLNLRISGYCPGRCFFCHRWHSHRLKPEERHNPPPESVLARFVEDESRKTIKQINRVMYISELFGNEDTFLASVSATRQALVGYGYSREQRFGCCAFDVQSSEGMKKLFEIVQPKRYSFTIEFFSNRQALMGKYKGIPMEEIYPILEKARLAGFTEIQVNYLAGIESIENCEAGFADLVQKGLVDSVGLSSFTAFSPDQESYRHETAWEPDYYRRLVSILMALKIKIYHPESFDMRVGYATAMERTDP